MMGVIVLQMVLQLLSNSHNNSNCMIINLRKSLLHDMMAIYLDGFEKEIRPIQNNMLIKWPLDLIAI